MGNYEMLKAAIEAVIKENGNGEITGEIMQRTLLAIVGSLGEGAQFAGIADSSTEPGEKDMKLFYIAGPGDYANFGGTHVPEGSIAVFPNVGGSWEGKVIRVLTIDEELSDSTNPVQNRAVKKAIDAVSKAAESGGSVATTGLLQLLLEHPDEPYTLTEEEVQSVFGGIENFRKAVAGPAGPLALRDVVFGQDGQNATFLLQPLYSVSEDMLVGFWVMDELMTLLGFKSNYISMEEENGAVSITYVNDTGPDGGLFYELPGSVRKLTASSTPEEIEQQLGPARDLEEAIDKGKLIVSGRWSKNYIWHGVEIVSVQKNVPAGGPYGFCLETGDLSVMVFTDILLTSYQNSPLTVMDITPQPKEDNALMTNSKTITGAINEINSKLPVYTTVPELTADYIIQVNPTNVEHIYYISIGDTVYNVTGADGIKWVDGIAPVAAANTTLVVSVINNLAVWGGF